MSRSYRKPYYKVGLPGMKTVGARMERRIVKQLLKPWRSKHADSLGYGCEFDRASWDEDGPCGLCICRQFTYPMEPLLPIRKQIVDGYDICDVKYYWLDDLEYYRK